MQFRHNISLTSNQINQSCNFCHFFKIHIQIALLQKTCQMEVGFYCESLLNFLLTYATPQRAKKLVESKRKLAWSAVINGGQALPPNPYLSYTPHDSFDERGFLRPEAYDASDQSQDSTEARLEQEIIFAENAKKAQEQALKQAIDNVAQELIEEVIHEEASNVGRDHVFAQKVVQDAGHAIESEVLSDLVQTVSKNVLKEARNEEIQRRLVST